MRGRKKVNYEEKVITRNTISSIDLAKELTRTSSCFIDTYRNKEERNKREQISKDSRQKRIEREERESVGSKNRPYYSLLW